MPLSRRYSPEWAPGESSIIGMDFSPVIPPGVGIVGAGMFIQTNTNPPAPADTDFTKGPVSWLDRTVYMRLSGGVSGRDYLLLWEVGDSDGNQINRTALMLCAPTS